jgi:predicted permease
VSIREFLRRTQADAELDEEIQAHLAMAIRDRVERGEDPSEAKAAALREFGNRGLVKEATRDVLGWNALERVFQDLRYGFRGLRRSPVFTLVALTSLALGIGANTAIFSLANAVLFRLLPVRDPGTLVELLQQYPGEPRRNGYWSWNDLEHFSGHNTVFSEIIGTAFDNILRVQTENGAPQNLVGEYVTSNYFDKLGVQPVFGQTVELNSDHEDSAVVSWRFWHESLQADPKAIGKRIFVANQPMTVIGVAPAEFVGLRVETTTDLWLPLTRRDKRMSLLARLRPSATVSDARSEMEVLYQFTKRERLSQSGDPLVRKLKVHVEHAGSGLNSLRDRFGRSLIILLCIVGTLLLITCANIAGLLLARGTAREREFALRAGLGAKRGRLMGQVFTESLLLATCGALLGIFVAYLGSQTLVHLLMTGRIGQRAYLHVQPDWHLALFAVGLTILTGLLFGAAPAIRAGRAMPSAALRQSGATGSKSNRRAAKILVAAQIALSALLLSTGALFVIHLSNLEGADLGFKRDRILLVTVDTSSNEYSRQYLNTAFHEILTRLRQIPKVSTVAVVSPTPLSGAGASGFIAVEGLVESPADRQWIHISYISPGYFQTIGSPILDGRDFRGQDELHPRVAIINQSLARRYFRGQNPIGRHITLFHVTLDPEPKTYEVIGMTSDAHYYEIREPESSGVYLPAFHDRVTSANNFIVKTRVRPTEVTRDITSAIRERLPKISILQTTTLAAQIDSSILLERLIATLSGWFAIIGLILASIGIYGLLAYIVAEETNAIGIRMALGATTGRVQSAMFFETLVIAIGGLALGIPLAMGGRYFASRLVQDLQVSSMLPIALGAIGIALGVFIAAYVPVRRASRVDPSQALRHE